MVWYVTVWYSIGHTCDAGMEHGENVQKSRHGTVLYSISISLVSVPCVKKSRPDNVLFRLNMQPYPHIQLGGNRCTKFTD